MNIEPPVFQSFNKIARLSRPIVITEKIDGTNAQVTITEDGGFFTGSRNRWITPESDNFGFSKWAHDHKDELVKLGVGSHFGEWWGCGIQRGYGLSERRWSLFNVGRWCLAGQTPKQLPQNNPKAEPKFQDMLPACCHLVPVLWEGMFDTSEIAMTLHTLEIDGSSAAPGFMQPEGIIIYHRHSGVLFKKTILKDDVPKGGVE